MKKNKRKKWNKFIVTILLFAMILTTIPSGIVFAGNEEGAATAAAFAIMTTYQGSANDTFQYKILNKDGTPYTGKYILYDAAGKKKSEGNLSKAPQGTIEFRTDASGYKLVITEAEKDSKYTIEVLKNGGMVAESDSMTVTALQQETPVEIESVFRETTKDPVELTKYWNDGNLASLDRQEDTYKEKYIKEKALLKFSIDGGTTWICPPEDKTGEELEKWYCEQLSVAEMPEAQPTYEGKKWTMSYEGLPKQIYENKGEEDETLKDVIYGFYEREVDGYIQSEKEEDDETSRMNTIKYEFEASVKWNDKNNKYESRPMETTENGEADYTEYIDGLTLKRFVGTINNSEAVSATDFSIADNITITPKEGDESTWKLNLANLPKYDKDGNEYTYYLEQADYVKENQWAYGSKYENVGANGFYDNALFENGLATNTLKYTTDFKFQVEWIDGGCTEYRDNTLYLYRYAEGEGDIDTASPVQGFDKMFFEDGILYYTDNAGQKHAVDSDANGFYTYVGENGSNQLDKYSPTGAKYVYFIKQKNLGNDDYKTTYYDKDDSSSYQDSNGNEITYNYLLDDGKIENRLSSTVDQNVTKTWDAKEMQGFGPDTSAEVVLQKMYLGASEDQNSTWIPVDGEEGEKTLTGFSAEVMTKSEAFSNLPGYTHDDETVNGVDYPAGTKLKYRVIEQKITVHNAQTGTQKTVSFEENQDIVTLKGVGPGGCDAVFEKIETNDGNETKIVNRLISQTKVEVIKNWKIYDAATQTYSTEWPEGKTVEVTVKKEDGSTLKDINGDVIDPVITLTKDTKTSALDNLPRFDSEGREITYYVTEKVLDADGTDVTSTYWRDITYSKKDDTATVAGQENVSIRKTVANLRNETHPEGKSFTFRVSKSWLDDGDVLNREPVTVAIYKKSDFQTGGSDIFNEDGSLKLENAKASVILTEGNMWTSKVTISLPEGDTSTKDDYIALEVRTGAEGNYHPVIYKKTDGSYAGVLNQNVSLGSIENATAENCGDVAGSHYYYHVYLGQTVTLGEPGFTIYNQRYGDLSINLNKTWKIGNTQMKSAVFQISQDNGPKVYFVQGATSGSSEDTVQTWNYSASATDVDRTTDIVLPVNQKVQCVELPKFDSLGRLIHYTMTETKMIGMDDQEYAISGGKSTVDLGDGKYDTYSCGVTETNQDIMGDESHHSGDIYTWEATNQKSQEFNVKIRKVWRDDGTNSDANVRRPDIYFRIYRISTNAGDGTLLTSEDIKKMDSSALVGRSTQIGRDYTWDTQHNNWYWTCDIDGSFERYDENGYEYLYFAKEFGGNMAEYETSYYNGITEPVDNKSVADTVAAFNPGDYETEIKNGNGNDSEILIIHKEGEGLQAPGSIVNTRIGQFDAEGRKLWDNLPIGFDTSNLPDVQMQIYRKLKTEDDIESNWKLVKAKTKDNAGNIVETDTVTVHSTSANTAFSYGLQDRYDEYGRTYEYKTKEITKISGYKSQEVQSGNAFVWTNTYDLTAVQEQRVEIPLTKTFVYPDGTTELPNLKFELWRQVDNSRNGESGIVPISSIPEKIATIDQKVTNLSEATTLADGRKQLVITGDDLKFIREGENNPVKENYLAYYAPNGKPYIYFVKEIVPGGYMGSVKKNEDDTTLTSKQGDGTSEENSILEGTDKVTLTLTTNGVIVNSQMVYTIGSAHSWETAYTNTYNGKPERTVEATKTWDDQSDLYDVRPDGIGLKLYRTDAETKNALTDTKVADSSEKMMEDTTEIAQGNWNTQTGNKWTYQFYNKDYKTNPNGANEDKTKWDCFSPAGKQYIYYAEESSTEVSADIDKYNSYAHSGQDSLAITNSLPTMNLTAKKVWKGTADGSTWTYDGTSETNTATVHSDAELKTLYELGAMPESITFTVQYKDNDTDGWKDLYTHPDDDTNKKIVSYTETLDTFDKVLKVRNQGYTFTKLPLYAFGNNGETGQDTKRKYRISESVVYRTGAVQTSCFQPSTPAVSEEVEGTQATAAVINTLTEQKVTLKKIWVDHEDRDNTRPASVNFKVSVAGNTETETYELKKQTTDTDVNVWTKEIYLPAGDVALTEEEVKTGDLAEYDTPVVSIDGTNAIATVTNTLKDLNHRKTISMNVEKSWKDEAYPYLYSQIRPESLTFTLQYKCQKVITWKEADAECGVLVEGTPETVPQNDKYSLVVSDGLNVVSPTDLSKGVNSITVKLKEGYDWSNQKVTWSGLYQYYDDSTTATIDPIQYRIVETDVNGYATAYDYGTNGNKTTTTDKNTGVSANKFDDTAAASTIVTNTVDDSVSISLQKNWADDAVLKTALSQAANGTDEYKEVDLTKALTKDNISKLQTLGILPIALGFQLQYQIADADGKATGTWNNLQGTETYPTVIEITTAEQIKELLTGKMEFAKLPKYNAQGKKILYRIQETGVKFTGDTDYRANTASSDQYLYKVTTTDNISSDTQKTTVTNTIPSAEITVSKAVEDEDNRDAKRGTVEFNLLRNGDETKPYASGTLTYDSTTKTWSTATFTVPVYNAGSYVSDTTEASKNVWTVKETSFKKGTMEYLATSQYEASVTYTIGTSATEVTDGVKANGPNADGTKQKNKAIIKNTYVPKRFGVTAKKEWDDYGNAMASRPKDSEVKFKLQYTLDDGATWKDVEKALATKENGKPYIKNNYYYETDSSGNTTENGTKAYTTSDVIQTVNGLATSEKKAEWNNLCVYSQGTRIIYRVVEKTADTGRTDYSGGNETVKGYKAVTFDDLILKDAAADVAIEKVSGIIGGFRVKETKEDTITSATMSVKNHIDTLTLDFTKNWSGDTENAALQAMRPESVTYLLEYSTNGTDWTKVPNGVAKYSVPKTEGSGTQEINVTGGEFTLSAGSAAGKVVKNTTTISGLPKCTANGTLYLYRVSEKNLNFKNADGTTKTVARKSPANSLLGTIGAYDIKSCTSKASPESATAATVSKWESEITNELPIVEASAHKNWKDDADRDALRGDVTFQIAPQTMTKDALGNVTYEDAEGFTTGTAPFETKTLAKTVASATVTWTKLPKYQKDASEHSADTLYHYKVTETQKTGYELPRIIEGQEKVADNTVTTEVTNVHNIKTFDLTANKTWEDATVQGIWCGKTGEVANQKPASISLKLQYQTKDAYGNAVWTDVSEAVLYHGDVLPLAKQSGAEVIYLKHTSQQTALDLNNKTTDYDAEGYYLWDASQSKYIPEGTGIFAIEPEKTVTKATDGSWSTTWNRLPVNSGGQVVKYRVLEGDVPYYFSSPSEIITGVNASGAVENKTTTITNKPLSLTLNKKDADGNAIQATFRIHQKSAETGYDSVIDREETTTDGSVTFTGLNPGVYEITETKTSQGHQLLAKSFEVTLPMTMTEQQKAEKEAAGKTVNTANAVLQDDGSWKFYQLTYTITNDVNLSIPQTGNAGMWYPGLLAVIPFAGVLLWQKKRKKKQRVG